MSRRRFRPAVSAVMASALHAALMFAVALPMGWAPTAAAEEAAAPLLSEAELDELVGPIALYPDELLAIVLPASTYPIEIVQAHRYLEKHKSDDSLEPDDEWDPSVLGLLNYPEVVDLMNGDLDWTWKLGEAVVAQQNDVMAAVQRFRAKADAAGNLATNEKMKVEKETKDKETIIVIESADPQVIYVPQYQPSTVVVYSTTPYPWYYSPPYPYYYSPAATFWTGMFVGAAIGYGVGWGWGNNNHIDIDRNVNIDFGDRNVDRDRDRDRDRGDRGDRGGKERWSQDKRPGKATGGRPGSSDRAARTQAVDRARSSDNLSRAGSQGGRSRPATGSRPAAASRPSTGNLGSAGQRPASGSLGERSSRGRDSTFGSSGSRSRSGSFGSYSNGSRTQSYSNRGGGSYSRGGGGGYSRGGGGFSRGGGGRRR